MEEPEQHDQLEVVLEVDPGPVGEAERHRVPVLGQEDRDEERREKGQPDPVEECRSRRRPRAAPGRRRTCRREEVGDARRAEEDQQQRLEHHVRAGHHEQQLPPGRIRRTLSTAAPRKATSSRAGGGRVELAGRDQGRPGPAGRADRRAAARCRWPGTGRWPRPRELRAGAGWSRRRSRQLHPDSDGAVGGVLHGDGQHRRSAVTSAVSRSAPSWCSNPAPIRFSTGPTAPRFALAVAPRRPAAAPRRPPARRSRNRQTRPSR